MKVLAKWLAPQVQPVISLEQDWEVWLRTLFGEQYLSDEKGNPIPFAQHQRQFWDWVWSIKAGSKVPPFIACWPRGGAKSTSAELAVVSLAARRARKYCLYISATQAQADDHVQNIAALFEARQFGTVYPTVGSRRVGKYGYSSGWNRQRIRTASGFTTDSLGLDTAARGVKLEEARPDLIIFDDVDKELDTPTATEKKIKLITTAMLPAGSRDYVVLGVQNLIIEDGIFARLTNQPTATKKADFLQNRIVSGPLPSVVNAKVIVPKEGPRAGTYTLVGGTAIWAGQGLTKAQQDIDDWGYSSWLSEAQQEVGAPPDGLFSHLDFESLHVFEVPTVVRTVVWCDPAVTNTDRSDSHGVVVDSLCVDGKLYRQWQWEGRDTPRNVLKLAIQKAIEFTADYVGVETDQGGDLWMIAYEKIWEELEEDAWFKTWGWDPKNRISFRSEKAGSGFGSKSHRASLMLRDYESNLIRHVMNSDNTHLILKRAMQRFPNKKPFDLVDACFWGWHDLLDIAPVGNGATDDTHASPYGTRQGTVFGAALHGRHADDAYTDRSDRLKIGRLWQGHAGQRTLWRQGGNPDQSGDNPKPDFLRD